MKIVYLFFTCFLFMITCVEQTEVKEPASQAPYMMTVLGKVDTARMGVSLIHEHITTDFIGAEKVDQPQYEQQQAIDTILPYLLKAKGQGVETLVECTPSYIGKDVRLLRKLSELSGINIITNTGYYAAREYKFIPKHAFTESADEIAARWLKDWEEGIDGTEIRPGFIKLGVGKGALDSLEEKLLLAAIQVHKKSGLPIAVHTGDGAAAQSEFDIVTREQLNSNALIWVHAQNGTDDERVRLAQKGVWISLDGIALSRITQYLSSVQTLKKAGLLSRTLISHDDGWSVEQTETGIDLQLFGNGNGQPYSTIHQQFLDSLGAIGFTSAEIDTLMRLNPRQAMMLRHVDK
jgi:phosphotriesterase-related protein